MKKSISNSGKLDYLAILKERAKTSRVYKKYQLTGLLIAQLLDDEKHKSLYIKLAKEHNQQKLLALAKDISERKNVENRGAYFMRVLFAKLTCPPNPVASDAGRRALNNARNRPANRTSYKAGGRGK